MTIHPTPWPRPAAGRVLVLALVLAGGAAPAAEADPGPSVGASAPASGPDEREQAHAEFKRRFDQGEFAAAVEPARRVVELTERAGSAPAEELQVALMNLGYAEQRAGDYVAAEASFQRVIDLIESSGRTTRPRLARAYAGLGTTYHAARRFDLATTSLERAVALNRRAEGLFNEEQLPLLDKLADALTETGRAEEAALTQRYALRVVARHDGERSLPFARRLESLGRWYTRVRAFESGRITQRRAVELVESLAGPQSPELAGPLTGLAENARRWLTDPLIRELASADEQRTSMFHDPVMPMPPSLSPNTIAAEGLKALERAAGIVDAHPDSSPALVAGVHSQLGDWHTARLSPERAKPSYQRAWQVAGAAPEGTRLQEALFGTPQLIRYLPPDDWDRHAQRPPGEIERRDVEIELTVTAEGGIRDPRVIGGDGDERLANRALRAADTARYRPRLVDGQPVDTPGVRFVQPFYVLRKDDAATDEPAPPAPPPPQGGG